MEAPVLAYFRPDVKLKSMLDATERDPVMLQLRDYASTSWPDSKDDVPDELKLYWNYRDEVHVEDGLVLRSNKIIVPKAKRNEVLKLLHAAHCGEVIYWPNITSDITSLACSCTLCQKYKPRNVKLPMLSHDVPTLPW